MPDRDQTTTHEPVYSAFSGEPDFDDLLEMFVAAISEKRHRFEELFRAGEIEQLHTQAHQLKGSGGGYGFDGLSRAAADLEVACKANDVDRVGDALDQLLAYMGRITV